MIDFFMTQLLSHPGFFIVTPTALEFTAVRKGLGNMLKEGNCQLMMCGVGEQQSSAFCRKLDQLAIARLVLIGWSGGLTGDLGVGDAICADTALRDGQPPLACTLPPGGNYRTGPILTAPKALLTPSEKQAAAASGALAVEMEAYPLAAWANQRSIPFIHGRVILDTRDEALPDMGEGLDSSGKVHVGALLKLLARRPALLQELARLNHRVQMLNPILGKLAADIVFF